MTTTTITTTPTTPAAAAHSGQHDMSPSTTSPSCQACPRARRKRPAEALSPPQPYPPPLTTVSPSVPRGCPSRTREQAGAQQPIPRGLRTDSNSSSTHHSSRRTTLPSPITARPRCPQPAHSRASSATRTVFGTAQHWWHSHSRLRFLPRAAAAAAATAAAAPGPRRMRPTPSLAPPPA